MRPPECCVTSLRVPLRPPSRAPSRSGGPWGTVLGQLVEIDVSDPTHFCAAQGTLGKLDRIFASAPGWCITQMCT
eukprot:1744086-Pyramimonas_sp.AAC.1